MFSAVVYRHGTMDRWLSSKEFAELLGVSKATSQRILLDSFQKGLAYKGVYLNVRQSAVRGGVGYRVLLSSIPPEFYAPNPEKTPIALVDLDALKQRLQEPSDCAELPALDLAEPTDFYDIENTQCDWLRIEQDFGTGSGLPDINAGYSLDVLPDGGIFIQSLVGYDQKSEYYEVGKSCIIPRNGNQYLSFSSSALERATPKFVQIEGSHDTRVIVRAHNNKLTFSGNPSKFDRYDNIFGYRINDAVRIINEVILPRLSSLDDAHFAPLPPWARFTAGRRVTRRRETVFSSSNYEDMAAFQRAIHAHEKVLNSNTNVMHWDSKDGYFSVGNVAHRKIIYVSQEIHYTGAQISQLDFPLNVSCGNIRHSDLFLAHCARAMLGKLSPRTEGKTVYWGKKANGRVKVKAYCKMREFRDHAHGTDFVNTPEYAHLLDYLQTAAIIRLEPSYFKEYLREQGMHYLGNFEHDGAEERLLHLTLARLKPLLRYDLETVEMDNLSRVERATYEMWFDGTDIKDLVKRKEFDRATYYRHRKGIEEKMGIDISVQRTTDACAPLETIRLIHIKPAKKPKGYYLPMPANNRLYAVK